MYKNLRQSILILIVLLSFLAFSFAAGAESFQTKKPAKTSPTPKKTAKAAPTPNKKASAKATPTPKKSSTTSAKSKTPDKKPADKKSASAKDTAKKTDAKTKKETSKNTKNTKSATVKTSATSKSKSKTDPKTASKTKDVKSNSKTKTTTAKTTTAKKTDSAKTTSKSKPKVEEPDAPDDASQVIVTDMFVPIRSLAKSTAPELKKVKLGTVLDVSQKSSSWYKVKYSTGTKTSTGWIPANAVGNFDSSKEPQIYTQVANRHYKSGMDFATSSALYEFLTDKQSDFESSDSSGDLQLKRLLALRSALKAIPSGAKDSEPYKSFLASHKKEIVYSEPSGENLVISKLFWDLHQKYPKSSLADEIAWEGAKNPLPGECEGYVNCHLFYARMTSGEYLSLHPTGKRSSEALTNLTNILEPIVADVDAKKVYNGPTDVTDRAEFNNLLAELRTIVSRLPLTEKEKTLQQLKKIAEGFR